MANFLGASFGFGAMDVGFKAAMTTAIKSVDTVSKGITAQLKSGNKLSKMWSGVKSSVDSFNIASIASNMNELNGNTGNLSNSLESMGVSMAQASKPIIAGMNLTSKEARKMTSRVTGMAIGLNVGAEQVAETLRAIHTAGGPAKSAIDAMAMSEKDWVRVTATTGVTMQDFSSVLGDMTASWGASPKQAGAMIDNIMAIGKKAGIGEHGIKGMKGQLDALDDIFEKLPPGIARTADEVQSLMESTYKLSGVFKTMGDTQEDATARGQDTAKMFAEQAVMIEKLYAVGGDQNLDESPLFKFLTQLGIGTEEAKSIIVDGSKDVVGGVTRINDIFAKMGGSASPQVQHALSGLSEALGSGASGLGFLAQSATVGKDRLKEMAAMTVNGAGALRKYGKAAHSSGRTLQESMDLARESFETQFRAIGRSDVRGFAKEQMKAYKSMGKELKVLGGDPVWGGLVKKMSIMNQMGSRGVFLSMSKELGLSTKRAQELGVGFELAMNTAKQMASEFSPVMEIMGMLGPMGGVAIAGGVASYFMLNESDRKEIFGSYYPVIQQIGDTIKTLWDSLPWDKIESGFKIVWDKVALYLSRTLERILGPKLAEQFGLVDARKAMEREAKVKAQADKIRQREAKAAASATSVFDSWQADDAWREGSGNMASPTIPSRKKTDWEVGNQAEKAIQAEEKGAKLLKKLSAHNAMKADQMAAVQAAAAGGAGTDEQQAASDLARKKHQMLGGAERVRSAKIDSPLNEIPIIGEGLASLMQGAIADTLEGSASGIADSRDSKRRLAMARYQDEQWAPVREIEQRKKSNAPVSAPTLVGAESAAQAWLSVAGMWTDTSEVADKAREGGTLISGSFGKGTVDGMPAAEEMTTTALTQFAKLFGGSLPEEGPFKNGENAMLGGRSIMEAFANGMYEAKGFVAETVTAVLDDAVIGSFEAYALKMEDVAKNKSLLKGVAKKMVQDMGGELKMGSVEVDGVNLDAQQTFEAAMSLPGLASVVAAIASDGHKTRVVLKKIQEDTSGLLARGAATVPGTSQAGQATLGSN